MKGLSKTQQELLDAMKQQGVIVYYVPMLGLTHPDPYYFRGDTKERCTAAADALRRGGYVEIYDIASDGHKLRAKDDKPAPKAQLVCSRQWLHNAPSDCASRGLCSGASSSRPCALRGEQSMMVANSSEMPKGVEHNVKLILKVDEISPLAGEHVRRMLILNDDCLAGKISVAVRTASIEREIRVLKNALLEEELRRIVAAFVEDLDTEAHAGAPSHEAGSEAIMDLPFDSIKEITDGENGQESKADDASMPMMFSSGGQETLTIKAEGLWRNPPPAFSLDMRGGGAKR